MDCDSIRKEFTGADTVRYINHVRWPKSDPVTVLTSAQSHSFDLKGITFGEHVVPRDYRLNGLYSNFVKWIEIQANFSSSISFAG